MIAVLALAAVLVSAPPDYKQLASSLTDTIESRFWMPERKDYAEELSLDGTVRKSPAFTWDKAVYLSGLAAGCRIDRKRYQPLFDSVAGTLQPYGCEKGGVYGYSDLPVHGAPDRYYDDNEWIVLADLDAYEATRRAGYLKDAEKVFKFVMSGESSDLGGGLFWRENERKTKNTCSNAPATAAAARLYLLTKKDSYRETALRLYGWLAKLRDSDGLMLDHIDLQGKVDRTKWTYNSALTIEAGVFLWQATHQPSFLEEAKRTAAAARDHWIDPTTGAIKDEASFAHHLADAFFLLARADRRGNWDSLARKAVDYAFENGRRDDFFGLRWDRYMVRNNRVILLYQASMLRGLTAAARR